MHRTGGSPTWLASILEAQTVGMSREETYRQTPDVYFRCFARAGHAGGWSTSGVESDRLAGEKQRSRNGRAAGGRSV
jgi:hypothetical protein